MGISKRVRNIGQTGSGVNLVSAHDIKEYDMEVTEFQKRTPKNVRELERLGSKFYIKYWGCVETTCGSCHTVYRLPQISPKGEKFTEQDLDDFYLYTRAHKCPVCNKGINEQMPVDPTLYLERKEVSILGMTVLKILAHNELPFEKEKVLRLKKKEE